MAAPWIEDVSIQIYSFLRPFARSFIRMLMLDYDFGRQLGNLISNSFASALLACPQIDCKRNCYSRLEFRAAEQTN